MADWHARLQTAGWVLILGSICIMATAEGFSISVLATMALFPLGLFSLHAAHLKPASSLSFAELFMTYFLNRWILPILSTRGYKKTWEAAKDPQKHQDEVLMKILAENCQTVFGKDNKLGQIKSREQFVKSFPLTKFDKYEKYVERIANGEKNIMTKADVIQLSASSGTTGKNKLYPLTDADLPYFRNFACCILYMLLSVHHFKVNRELHLSLYHPATQTAGGIKITGIAAAKNDPKPCKTNPAALPKITKEGASYFIQALFGLREKHVDYMAGTSSDLMLAFFRSMEFNKDALYKAIATGHIDPYPDLDEDVRQELNKTLTPDPERAKKVLKEIERGSDGFAYRVWPLLDIVLVGRTGAFAHSAKLMESSYLKNVKMVLGLHAATEGFFGCSMTREDLSEEIYTFCPTYLFLEFIKVEEMDQTNPNTFLLSELQVGQMYEVVVTNWHGLYRNRFGDVIKIVGYTENTPKYIFQYRTGQILNCAFDRTPEQVFYEALKMAESQWATTIANYTSVESIHMEAVTGEKYRKNHYVAFIETKEDIKLDASHSAVLEEKLFTRHETYADFRKQDSVGPISIIQVSSGTFDGLREVLWGNRPNLQYKTPRVLRNQKALEYLWNNRIR